MAVPWREMTQEEYDANGMRPKIREWLSQQPAGFTYTMRDVRHAIAAPVDSEVKRRYREIRQELEARGWVFDHSGYTHTIIKVGPCSRQP